MREQEDIERENQLKIREQKLEEQYLIKGSEVELMKNDLDSRIKNIQDQKDLEI